MNGKIISGAIVTVAVAAGAFLFVLGGGSGESASTPQGAISAIDNACSEKTLADFTAYLKKQGNQAKQVYQWENTTNLENCGVRLNKLVFKDDSEEFSVYTEYTDVISFEDTPEMQKSDIYLHGISDHNGKSFFQSELEDAGMDDQLGVKGDLPSANLHVVNNFDGHADTVSTVVKLEQDSLFDLFVDIKMSKVKAVVEALEKSPSLNQKNGWELIGLLSNSLLEKLEVSIHDKGMIAIERKKSGYDKGIEVKECRGLLGMFGIENSQQICQPISDFSSGKNNQLSVKMNPDKPVELSRLIQMVMGGDVSIIGKMMKELNITFSN